MERNREDEREGGGAGRWTGRGTRRMDTTEDMVTEMEDSEKIDSLKKN